MSRIRRGNGHGRGRGIAALVVAAIAAVLVSSSGVTGQRVAGQARLPIVFTNVTAAAGITFTHVNGAYGKKYLPETMGPGVVWLDVDGDDDQDLFLVNGKAWPNAPRAAGAAAKASAARSALYRNNGDGTFTDITAAAGLAIEMYGFGGAAADFDNDGDVDLFVTALDGNHLFRNAGNGNGAFVEVTTKAGIGVGAGTSGGAPAFSTSAAWVDYDKDGWLDLVVLNYVRWSIDTDRFCALDGKTKSYCTPEAYPGVSPALYHNRRDGTFEDVTKAAGLFDPSSKALGIALLDYNADGWLDLFIANDTQPNKLYRNNGGLSSGGRNNGGPNSSGANRASSNSGSSSGGGANSGKNTFTDEAVAAGVAFNDAGVARAGMGTDAADYDASGRDSLVVGNFSNEMMALYHNEGSNLFLDEAPNATIGQASRQSLTFSCFFFDYDLDGWPDIFAANGHVADDIQRAQPKLSYAQPPLLFRNAGNRKFDVTTDAGAALKEPIVARGAAYADFDLDGDPDIIIATNGGAARLLRNDGGNRSRALRLTLIGTKSNRSAIGARVTVTLETGTKRRAMVKTGSSYLSQSELPLTFGVGQATKVAAIEIQWPSGQLDRLPATETNQQLTIQEARGITRRAPLGATPARAAASPTPAAGKR
jgi:hypothetical protein